MTQEHLASNCRRGDPPSHLRGRSQACSEQTGVGYFAAVLHASRHNGHVWVWVIDNQRTHDEQNENTDLDFQLIQKKRLLNHLSIY